MEYLIVPRRITNKEVKIDLFVGVSLKGKVSDAQLHRMIQGFVSEKIRTDWTGLKLVGIGRVSSAAPPDETYRRGTIEEILGARLGK
jgi:hypothetical protein